MTPFFIAVVAHSLFSFHDPGGYGGGGYSSHGDSNTQQGAENMTKDQSFWAKYTFKVNE